MACLWWLGWQCVIVWLGDGLGSVKNPIGCVCVGGEVEGDTKIYNYAHTSN